MKKVSIIIPLFNEEKIVGEFFSRIIRTIDKLHHTFELVVVDDGSTDDTLSKLLAIQDIDSRLRIVKLSRNWGHQNAYNAGLDIATGDAVIFMDGDLEDPPELIEKFVKEWEMGFEVVYTVKESRKESLIKKILFALFYKLMRQFSDVPIVQQAGMFSLIDEKVAAELRKCRERNKYYVGLRSFVGYRQKKLFYHRDMRYSGNPKQTYWRLLNYALNAFFSFSFLPIRLVTYSGLFILLLVIILSILLFTFRILNINFWLIHTLPGWTSLALLILFILATQIIFMGIVGEYIARIFDEVRNRPYYIVDTIFEHKADIGSREKDIIQNSRQL